MNYPATGGTTSRKDIRLSKIKKTLEKSRVF
jgi:hypothetical protein